MIIASIEKDNGGCCMSRILVLAKKIYHGETNSLFSSQILEKEMLLYETDRIGKRRKGYEELYFEAKAFKADTLLCEEEFLDVAIKLSWQLESVQRLILIDGENPMQPESGEKKVQALLWDNIADKSDDIISQSGWVSSISGEPFSQEEMDEYAGNVLEKIGGYLRSTDNVLEIGVASGITCFKVAPKVSMYYGIDLSKKTIEKTERELAIRGIVNVQLEQRDASEIEKLKVDKIDCVIINSVAQYFPGYNYFFDVLRKCVSLMNDNGIIFLGDMLSFEMIEKFDEELSLVGGKRRNKRDLWYPKKLIEAIPFYVGGVCKVEYSPKVGNISNELVKYRKDILLFVDKTKSYSACDAVKTYSLMWKDLKEIALKYNDSYAFEVLGGIKDLISESAIRKENMVCQ